MTGAPPPQIPPSVAWWVVLLKEVGFPTFMALVLLYAVVVHFPKLLQDISDKATAAAVDRAQIEQKLDLILMELRKR